MGTRGLHVPLRMCTRLADFHKQGWVRSLPITASFPVCAEYIVINRFPLAVPTAVALVPPAVLSCLEMCCNWSPASGSSGCSLPAARGITRQMGLSSPPAFCWLPISGRADVKALTRRPKAHVLWFSVTMELFLCSLPAPSTLLKPHWPPC